MRITIHFYFDERRIGNSGYEFYFTRCCKRRGVFWRTVNKKSIRKSDGDFDRDHVTFRHIGGKFLLAKKDECLQSLQSKT